MDRVNGRLFFDLDRFVVLDPNLHVSGGLYFCAVIDEFDIVEPGKRQRRILVILILQATQGFLIVRLINFRIALFGDLFSSEFNALRKLCICAEFRIDNIAVIDSIVDAVFIVFVYIFVGELCLFCDQLNLFDSLAFSQRFISSHNIFCRIRQRVFIIQEILCILVTCLLFCILAVFSFGVFIGVFLFRYFCFLTFAFRTAVFGGRFCFLYFLRFFRLFLFLQFFGRLLFGLGLIDSSITRRIIFARRNLYSCLCGCRFFVQGYCWQDQSIRRRKYDNCRQCRDHSLPLSKSSIHSDELFRQLIKEVHFILPI